MFFHALYGFFISSCFCFAFGLQSIGFDIIVGLRHFTNDKTNSLIKRIHQKTSSNIKTIITANKSTAARVSPAPIKKLAIAST